MLPAALGIMPVAALDARRFGWSTLPTWAVAAGYAVFLAGFALGAWAQAVNEFFEPGVRIQSERHQRVIDAGPYALIRHPGYVSGMLVFAGTALSLGSLWALVPAALASIVLVVRTAREDRLLRARLPGYQDYVGRVRWRLVPGLW
jgi:protein-S-isoprenylcysteine O-methyltransferase Ste14